MSSEHLVNISKLQVDSICDTTYKSASDFSKTVPPSRTQPKENVRRVGINREINLIGVHRRSSAVDFDSLKASG